MTSSSGYSPAQPEMHRKTDLLGMAAPIYPNARALAAQRDTARGRGNLTRPHLDALAQPTVCPLPLRMGRSRRPPRYVRHDAAKVFLAPAGCHPHTAPALGHCPASHGNAERARDRPALAVRFTQDPHTIPHPATESPITSSPSALIRERRSGPGRRVDIRPRKSMTFKKESNLEFIRIPRSHRSPDPRPRRRGLHRPHARSRRRPSP